MAYKVVKYRLTAEGTIPTFLKFGVPQATGGMYPVYDSSVASPRDHVMIGIADDGADISDSGGEIASKDALTAYLTYVGSDWKVRASDGISYEDFVPETAATKIWNDLTTLNGD
tara:strand:- start:681 stop:1022 length:342 start_codon:yes stop_codon:yes gene_type:complete